MYLMVGATLLNEETNVANKIGIEQKSGFHDQTGGILIEHVAPTLTKIYEHGICIPNQKLNFEATSYSHAKREPKKNRTWTIQRRILQIIIALPAHKQRTIAVYQAVQILNEWWFQDFIGTPCLKYHQTCWVSASPGVAKTCANPNEPPVTESRTSSVLGSLALRRPQPHL